MSLAYSFQFRSAFQRRCRDWFSDFILTFQFSLNRLHPYRNLSSCNLELWTMILAIELDLNSVEANQHDKYLGQRSFHSVVRAQRHTNTADRLLFTATKRSVKSLQCTRTCRPRLERLHKPTTVMWVVTYTHGKSDVVYSYHIYASCFPAMMWGKVCEVFATVTSLSQ